MRSSDQILERVNAIRPNSFGDFLGDYLKAFELRVRREIFDEDSPVYDASSLALDAPDDMIYELYLFTVIDFLCGEFGRFENTSAAFMSAWEDLVLSKSPVVSDDHTDPDTGSGSGSGSDQDTDDGDSRIKLW